MTLIFFTVSALAAVREALTFAWLAAREKHQRGRTLTFGIAHEIVSAVPLVVALEIGRWWPVLAGVVGSTVGCAWSMRHATSDE